jgi:hypothetical protein
MEKYLKEAAHSRIILKVKITLIKTFFTIKWYRPNLPQNITINSIYTFTARIKVFHLFPLITKLVEITQIMLRIN